MKLLLINFCLFTFGLNLSRADIVTSDYLVDKEKLVYVAKWTGIPAGEISMQTNLDTQGNFFGIELKAKTNFVLSMVYKVRDTIRTRIKIKSFSSSYYYKDVRQGRRHLEEIAIIDDTKLKIRYSKQNHSAGEKANVKLFDIKKDELPIQDPLSIIYLLRTLDFSKFESETIHVFADKGVYRLKFRKIGESKISTVSFGTREVIHVEPTAEYQGAIVSSGKLELWLDRESRIPLRLKFSIPVGWAALELKESNHPLLISQSLRNRRNR